jgi:secreted PhoX family phosphatase
MKTFLSLAAVTAIAVTFTACGSSGGSDSVSTSSNVVFEGITTPTTTDEKTKIRTSTTVTVDGVAQTIGFTKLMSTTDTNNGETFGLVKDIDDNPITFDDGSPYICNGTNSGVGSGLDFTSILQKNDKLYMVSQFECQIGAMYKAELEQDSTTGALNVKADSLEFISQKEGFGGFVHCAGQATPWQSHLGSEEYETDARTVLDANETTGLTGNTYYDETAKFWGGDATKMSPYYYGWTPEVSIDSNGDAVYKKHYSMGRFSHELSFVMPDNKTVYASDDGTNVAIFKYIADTEQDLSAGTLYSAKWTQTSSENGGSANISWIELGHATDAEIEAILNPDGDILTNDAPTFSDIFEFSDPVDGACEEGFSSVNATPGHECLKVKSGMEKAAAFLESRRYAGIMGATTEFRKMEGISYSPEHEQLFIAMSAVERGMEDNMKAGEAETKYDIGGSNDVKLPYNYCGAVYALDIDSNMNATTMTAILTGDMIDEDADGNQCDLDNISNPDNVTMLEGTDLLFIGEDTSKHINNVIWSYNLESKELTRVLTTPLDAETTSPFWYKNINGYSYMTAVTQHPMGDQEADESEKQSSIGVLGPISGVK